jgi:hypothetical protein
MAVVKEVCVIVHAFTHSGSLRIVRDVCDIDKNEIPGLRRPAAGSCV